MSLGKRSPRGLDANCGNSDGDSNGIGDMVAMMVVIVTVINNDD